MVHDKQRGWEIGRKVRYQLEEGIDAPGRKSDDYDVMPLHGSHPRTRRGCRISVIIRNIAVVEMECKNLGFRVRGGRLSLWVSFC
jgi:hypothetical protein